MTEVTCNNKQCIYYSDGKCNKEQITLNQAEDLGFVYCGDEEYGTN